MSRPRILMLHPPAAPRRAYQLDGYCSQPQKGPFRWHPVEFCVFSGRWSEEAELGILDLGTRPDAAELPGLRDYDAVVGLVGVYGWDSHLRFWKDAIAAGARVYLSGDLARYHPRYVFDAIPGLAGILPELAAAPRAEDLHTGKGRGIWTADQTSYVIPRIKAPLRLGVQRFELWDPRLYRLPFAPHPFASTVTQVGCPHRCDYCILSTYSPRHRDLEELSEELHRLRTSGARHLYVRDATLNSSTRHLEGVCERLARCGLPWNAFARADGIGRHASMLAKSGCRVLMLGIDSPHAGALGHHGKLGQSALADEVAALGRAGIQTVGHFVLGLDADPSTGRDVVHHARALGLDWLTLSPLMVRPGTATWPGPELLGEDADVLEGRARAREIADALRRFYLRPRPLLRVARTLGGQPGLAARAARSLVPRFIGAGARGAPGPEEDRRAQP